MIHTTNDTIMLGRGGSDLHGMVFVYPQMPAEPETLYHDGIGEWMPSEYGGPVIWPADEILEIVHPKVADALQLGGSWVTLDCTVTFKQGASE